MIKLNKKYANKLSLLQIDMRKLIFTTWLCAGQQTLQFWAWEIKKSGRPKVNPDVNFMDKTNI